MKLLDYIYKLLILLKQKQIKENCIWLYDL